MATHAIDFSLPASAAALDKLAANLRERNFEVLIVDSAAEAKQLSWRDFRKARRSTPESRRPSRMPASSGS